MKVLQRIAMVLSALALCTACSNEDEVFKNGETTERGLTATIPAYQFDDGTRVNISDDLQTFTWSDGDKLGIYYDNADLETGAWYTIKQGGSNTGVFSNDAFYLNPEKTYYAFYPYNSDFTTTAAEVDFTGQVQAANASATHLGAYNYMYGSVNIGSKGGASVAFKNLGSVMQLQVTVSNAATFTGIDISSDGAEFITKGKASMINGSISATETSSSIHLDFESGITLNAGDVLTANILVAPVDMSGSTLTITLIDADNNDYEVTTAGKNMLQGKAYLYAETMAYIDVDDIPYVTFTADAEQTFHMSKAVSTLEYSVNGGSWTELGTTQVTFGSSLGELRLRGKNLSGTSTSSSSYSNIHFWNATKVACRGDIRTLLNYENYKTITTSGNFRFLFSHCTQLTSAPKLPATNLANSCYEFMFYGCTSLTQAPELPATNLAEECYSRMFYGCTSLTQAPELPATNLAAYCYLDMFSNCTSLTQAPKLLATNLAFSCYSSMFCGCTSLTTAPQLPATTLAESCYNRMFLGCSNLVNAPTLPSTTLTSYCYWEMFNGCSKLNYIKMMATDISAYYCLTNWVNGVSSTGTFVKSPSMTTLPTGYDGIPTGWTVVDGSAYHDPEMSGSDIEGDW